jgi:hypothetical protein
MNLKPRSSLLGIHSILVWFNVLVPLFVGTLMVMGWTQSQSHHPSRMVVLGLRSGVPWLIRALGLQSLGLLRKLVQSFSSGSSFCGALDPLCPTLLLWSVIASTSGWSRPSSNNSHNFHVLLIWFQVAFSMPRLRGKSKRGATWYAAKGRGTRGCGQQARPSSPQDPECVSTPEPLIAPTPSSHLIFLLGPPLLICLRCRLLMLSESNGSTVMVTPSASLQGSVHPPPPPASTSTSTSHHLHLPCSLTPLSSLSSPIPCSDSPTSSSDSPPPPLPSSACSRCAGRNILEESLDAIKRGIEDIKGVINEMQHKEKEWLCREELLMTLLQDLRQVISDRGKLG